MLRQGNDQTGRLYKEVQKDVSQAQFVTLGEVSSVEGSKLGGPSSSEWIGLAWEHSQDEPVEESLLACSDSTSYDQPIETSRVVESRSCFEPWRLDGTMDPMAARPKVWLAGYLGGVG